MDNDLKTFARELASDVDDAIASGEGEAWKENEFTRQVLERLGEAGVLENPVFMTTGGQGRFGNSEYAISGFAVPDDDDPERIIIATTIFKDEWGDVELAPGDLKTAAVRASRFVLASLRGLHTKLEPSNTDASDLARRLKDLGDRIHTVRIAVLTDCRAGRRTLAETEAGSIRFAVDVYDMERLHRILGKGRTREDIEFRLGDPQHPLPCLEIVESDHSFDTYLTAIPGGLIADVYERYGTRLLELNVRAFLGVRGKKTVNAGLRETITRSPRDFLAFNNGIVATVDSVETGMSVEGTSGLVRVTGLQIVNGGQTTASLHRARRIDKTSLEGILVPVKLIHVRNGDLAAMVANISRTANSQNTIQPADFSANDPIHVAIETQANAMWCPDGRTKWFYDRARGAYDVALDRASATKERLRKFQSECPKDKRFSKTDLAKYINAWEGFPHLVSLGGQKNFQGLMQRLKDDGRTATEIDDAWYRRLISIAIVFRATARVVKANNFPAYQANITAYLVSALSFRSAGVIDSERVWRAQSVSPELLQLLHAWAPKIDALIRKGAGARMPTEWTKRQQCWETMQNALPAFGDVLPPEFR